MSALLPRKAAVFAAFLLSASGLPGQEAPAVRPLVTVPRVIRFSGSFQPANGLPVAPVESVTLSIYREEHGGTPLWQEIQNVPVDAEGRYTVLLGSTQNDGIPLEVFSEPEPRWLGAQFNRPGEVEQPRVLLASVPYALKAADAETLGGLPASAYMRTTEPSAAATESLPDPKELKPKAITGTPTANSVVKFTDGAGDMGNSIVTDNGTYVAVAGQAAVGSGHASQTYGFDLYVNGTNPTALVDAYGNPGTASVLLQGRTATGPSSQTLSVNGAGLFSITPNGFGSPVLSIAQNGNLGIGTSAPASKLAVLGQAAVGSGGSNQTYGYDLYVNGVNPTAMLDAYGNPGTASLTLQGRAANVYSHRLSVNGTGLFSIAPSSLGTAALSINQSGNVGIGTSSPGTKLEVAGTLKLDGSGNGIIFPDGTQQTTAAANGSSGSSSAANTQAIALLRWYNANLQYSKPGADDQQRCGPPGHSAAQARPILEYRQWNRSKNHRRCIHLAHAVAKGIGPAELAKQHGYELGPATGSEVTAYFARVRAT
jgi:trimeric autotransporter adhesin